MIFNRGIFRVRKKAQPFTKSDLKDGDLVIRRDESVELAMPRFGMFLVKGGGRSDFDEISNDLLSMYNRKHDIVKVYRPLFERKEPEEITLEEIEAALGYKIKLVGGDKNA